SALLRAHPGWAVRDAEGGPLTAGVVAGLGIPRRYCALDLSRLDVLDHLKRLFQALVSNGFEVLKVDFLTAGAVAGVRPDPRSRGPTRSAARSGPWATTRAGGPATRSTSSSPTRSASRSARRASSTSSTERSPSTSRRRSPRAGPSRCASAGADPARVYRPVC